MSESMLEKLAATPVEDLMHRGPVSVSSITPLIDVVQAMRDRYGAILIVDNDNSLLTAHFNYCPQINRLAETAPTLPLQLKHFFANSDTAKKSGFPNVETTKLARNR